MKRFILAMVLFSLLMPCLSAQNVKTIEFKLFLKDTDEANSYILTLPTDIAFDKDDSVYILDRREYSIFKFDMNGKFISSIGKKGNGPGEIQFPMSIAIKDGYLFLFGLTPLINKYNLAGQFISSTPKEYKFVQDIKAFPEKFFLGTEYNGDELNISLKRYDWSGKMTNIIDKIDYKHYFSKKQLDESRSLMSSNIEDLTYNITNKGEIIYARTDKYEIRKHIDGKSKVIIKEDHRAKKIGNRSGAEAKIKNTKSGPVLSLEADSCSLVSSLMTDAQDNIWFGTTSQERTGFVKYSPEGKFLAFYKVKPYSLTDTTFYMSQNYIYYIYFSSEKIEIYRGAIPK
jgi:hypothetical protein